ncbi:hypothetical protein CEJ88_16275, partial [Staphylococcus aureus]|uniref:hypothetical protein n=1 Tax=Staphylococcus aureus TaxID=1280 RepID=UPI000B65374E
VPFVYFTIRYVKFRKELWYLGILFLTTLTSISNIYVAAQMKTYVTPFDRIERSACNLSWQDIYQKTSIVMHPGFDRTIYWKTYLAHAQTAQSCHRNIYQFADRAPKTQAISE